MSTIEQLTNAGIVDASDDINTVRGACTALYERNETLRNERDIARMAFSAVEDDLRDLWQEHKENGQREAADAIYKLMEDHGMSVTRSVEVVLEVKVQVEVPLDFDFDQHTVDVTVEDVEFYSMSAETETFDAQDIEVTSTEWDD